MAQPETQSSQPPPTTNSLPPTAADDQVGTTKTATVPDPSSRPSSVTKASPTPVTKKKIKSSFWDSLIAVLIPCASPKSTSRSHDIELDDPSKKKGIENGNGKGKEEGTESATPSRSRTLPSALTVPTTGSEDVTLVVPPSPSSHLLPREETEGVTSGAVQPPGSTGGSESAVMHSKQHLHVPPTTAHTVTSTDYSSEDATFTTDHPAEDGTAQQGDVDQGHIADMEVEDEDDEEERLILQGGTGIPIGPDGQPCPLLPPVAAAHKGRKCLVLDLDETLLHSSFKLIPQADYVVPVEIEWQWHNVYCIKRPGVDNFLKKMGELYEVVIFTASLSKYADPVLDKLDIHKVISHRLFRESCYNHKGNYVKDLSRLGRPVEDMIILDNSPASYIFHPNNAVPVSSWFNDPHDTELTDLCPFLADLMHVEDVRGVLDGGL